MPLFCPLLCLFVLTRSTCRVTARQLPLDVSGALISLSRQGGKRSQLKHRPDLLLRHILFFTELDRTGPTMSDAHSYVTSVLRDGMHPSLLEYKV